MTEKKQTVEQKTEKKTVPVKKEESKKVVLEVVRTSDSKPHFDFNFLENFIPRDWNRLYRDLGVFYRRQLRQNAVNRILERNKK